MAGQPQIGTNPFIAMDCNNLVCNEPGLPSSLIVNAAAPFQLSVNFNLAGSVWPAILALAAAVPGPDFQIQYSYESMGAGPEGTLGAVNVNANAGQLNYSAPQTALNIAAGSLPVGTYKLVATVRTLIPMLGWVTGFQEGPIIQVYA